MTFSTIRIAFATLILAAVCVPSSALAGPRWFVLENEPEDMTAEEDPPYGLRLDGLFTDDAADIYTFDFSDLLPNGGVAARLDSNGDLTIIGRGVAGGLDVGSVHNPAGRFDFDFKFFGSAATITGDTSTAYQDVKLVYNGTGTGTGSGNIRATSGFDTTPIQLAAKARNSGDAFTFEVDNTGALSADIVHGFGWLLHGWIDEPNDLQHYQYSDWGFLGSEVGTPPPVTDVPEPASLAVFGVLGVLGVVGVRRRRDRN